MSDFEEENQIENSGAGAPEGNSGDAPYRVGYKSPPRHSRFKPGQSGFPSGRSPDRPNNKTIVTRVVNETISVRVGNKTRRISKFEAMLQGQLVKAIKGDSRATKMVCEIMQRYGLLTDREDAIAIQESQRSAPANKVSFGSAVFDNLDASLLSPEDMIELSQLVEIVESSDDVLALNSAEYGRLQQLVKKGRGKATPGEESSASETSS
jgi:hypothetical protein